MQSQVFIFLIRMAVNYAKKLKPSKRGELEIIDLINQYKLKNKLSAEFLGRGGAWLDTGSISDYYKTSTFVQAVENRQGFKIACLEEIALLNNWINNKDIQDAIKFYGNCEYSSYLKKINLMIKKSKFKDLIIINNTSFKDKRGYFKELLKEKKIKKRFPFLVMSFSKKNVIRGLHAQKKILKENL